MTNKHWYKALEYLTYTMYTFTLSECVPDPSAFDANSDMSEMAQRMRKMLQEAEPVSRSHPMPNFDNVQGKVTLQSLSLRLGDKVMVGGVKVRLSLK